MDDRELDMRLTNIENNLNILIDLFNSKYLKKEKKEIENEPEIE